MVFIPGGKVVIGLSSTQVDLLAAKGSDNEWFRNCTPQRTITLEAFYIDKFEVSNKEYHDFDRDHFFQDAEADFPVTNISWNDASEYAKWEGKQLPTEEQWECAARGKFGRLFPWGDNTDINKSYSCSIKVPGYNSLVPRSLFKQDRSTYGVRDMGGNACEWTSSRYKSYPGNKIFNRKYGKDYYVIRGGSFLYGYLEAFCANRKCGNPDLKNYDIGFRCVMSVKDYIKKYGRKKHLENLRFYTKNQ